MKDLQTDLGVVFRRNGNIKPNTEKMNTVLNATGQLQKRTNMENFKTLASTWVVEQILLVSRATFSNFQDCYDLASREKFAVLVAG